MKHRSNTHPTVKYSQMNSVPKLFSCSYADCWTEKHFSTEFGVLTPNHTHSHTLFWGCVSRWFGRALAWHARGQRFDPAILHQKSTVLRLKCGAFLFAFLEVALKICQMPDFAGAWTAAPNSCCFVVFENACSMPDCFADGQKQQEWNGIRVTDTNRTLPGISSYRNKSFHLLFFTPASARNFLSDWMPCVTNFPSRNRA